MTMLMSPLRRLTERQRLVRDMKRLAGSDVRAFWLPKRGDGTTVIDEVGNLITWINAPVLTAQGKGYLQTFNGTTDAGYIADADKFTFINQPFSVVALVNVTDTAAGRRIAAKWDNNFQREWFVGISSTDAQNMSLYDESAAKQNFRTGDAGASQGALAVLGWTHDGSGGATAMSGAKLYQNGALIASTAAEDASFVATENLTGPLAIGANFNTFPTVQTPFSGKMGGLLVVGGVIGETAQQEISRKWAEYAGPLV